jgi:pyruvate,water dikinase
MYMNLSNVMWLANPKVLSKSSTANDALLAEILANIDEKQYRPVAKPPWIRLRMVWIIPKILWWLRGFFKNTLYAMLSPERAYQTYQRKVTVCEKINISLPLKEFQRTYFAPVIQDMFNVTMAALTASLVAMGTVDRVVGKKLAEEKALVDKLKRGFTGNVVVEMGIMLFRLAKQLDRSDLADLSELADRVESRRMPAEFLREWDNFLLRYGCRGPPMEMDPASPRYGDDPGLALRQISFMSVDDEDFNPEVVHRRQIKERRRAYEELMSRSGWVRRILLQRIHRIIELFAGSRDTPKYHIVLFNYALRKRALIEGQHLVRENRLDAAEDVFDLTLQDLEAAANNPSMNLRDIRKERTRFLKILKAQVTEFPNVIDSRGRILRPPPRKEKTGEMSGMAVSPGVVTGTVKVLRNPHEKSVNKGDVLVAYTTDPGWTPLFINAAAVLLEVGGVLQHGAVIAREYGKPCVVGIDGLMTKLYDGQRVEVDGTSGVIRLLSKPERSRDENQDRA